MTREGKVRLHHLPDWLRRAWIKAHPLRRGASIAGWQIAEEIDLVIARDHKIYPFLDHWGSCKIEGQVCFVTEPYNLFDQVWQGVQLLADIVGGVPSATRKSEWGFGTVRGVVAQKPVIAIDAGRKTA